jgi:hypothetical protein
MIGAILGFVGLAIEGDQPKPNILSTIGLIILGLTIVLYYNTIVILL